MGNFSKIQRARWIKANIAFIFIALIDINITDTTVLPDIWTRDKRPKLSNR